MSENPVRSQYVLRPVFENRLDLAGELIGERPIEQAMIKRESQGGDGTNPDRVVDHYRFFLHSSQAQDGHLRLIDNRCGEYTAETPEVGDGERATLYFIGLQLAGTRARREIDNGALQAHHVLLIGVANYWYDQPILERNRDP